MFIVSNISILVKFYDVGSHWALMQFVNNYRILMHFFTFSHWLGHNLRLGDLFEVILVSVES